jgi:hypothetical protein
MLIATLNCYGVCLLDHCAQLCLLCVTIFSFFHHRVTQVRADEYGVEETVTVRQPAPLQKYAKDDVFVPPVLAKWLRPHQREGVQFMYECVMGLKNFNGNGCILADDMGEFHNYFFS